MIKIEKPASISILGKIIFILGVIFLLASIFIVLDKVIWDQKYIQPLRDKLHFEDFLFIIILMTFRALYHIVMGIAIVKEQNWGRMWFLWLQAVELGLGMFFIDIVDGARAVLFLIFLFLLTRPNISEYMGRVKVPLKYTLRSLFTRPITTILTILGISLVSFMFCGILMLASGIQKALGSTGEKDNVVLLEEDQFSEVQSMLTPEEVGQLENLGYFAYDDDLGEQLFSPELVVSLSIQTKSDTAKYKNLTLRGVTEVATHLRRDFKLLDGELYTMGMPTCIVGKTTAQKMYNCNVGDSLNISGDYYQVVGIFETRGSTYNSEVWADIYSLRDSYNRGGVAGSIVLARLENENDFDSLVKTIEDKPDLEIRGFLEQAFYQQQAGGVSFFLKRLGMFICIVFALGATIGAMITMYSAVANRTNEIATMRSLGFQAEGIQAAFLIESMLIGIIGAVVGIGAASIMATQEIQMFSTFSFYGEFYLKMTLTLLTVFYTFIFALSMGFIGGVFPSIKATNMKIIDSFR